MRFKLTSLLTLLCALSLNAFAAGKPVTITDGPRVEFTNASSAVIAWSTSAPSSSVVRYGTNGSNLDKAARSPYTAGTHRVTIRGLRPGSTYSFMVDSGQARGTGSEAKSGLMTFATKASGTGVGGVRQDRDADRDKRHDGDHDADNTDRDHDGDHDGDKDHQDKGKHKGWKKGKHNPHKDGDHDADDKK